METDPYYLQNEKIINEYWRENNLRLEKAEREFLGLDEYHSWGGGRFDSPPF